MFIGKKKTKAKKPKPAAKHISITHEEKDPNPTQIIGTSNAMEKEYLRITTTPDPSTIRPLKVLQKSLVFCLKKYENTNDYEYISEQLRSIRQDIVVQGIKNEFSLEVYETHTLLAIEHEDWFNYQQIHDHLQQLYEEKFGESKQRPLLASCRVMYLMGVDDVPGLASYVPRLPKSIAHSSDVLYAIEMWKYLYQEDFARFLDKVKLAKPLQKHVLNMKIGYVRQRLVQQINSGVRGMDIKGYQEMLKFDTPEATKAFLEEIKAPIPPV